MLPNIVNKIVFELHCKNESVAGSTSQKILHSGWTKINQVIDRVLKQYGDSSNYHRFSKIEIDLGRISPQMIDEDEFLLKFQYIFEEQLNRLSPHRETATIEQTDWEALKTWLLLGDLPWWVDKKSNPDMKTLLKKTLIAYPERLTHFVREHQHTPALIQRLSQLSKIPAINHAIQGIANSIGAAPGMQDITLPAFIAGFEKKQQERAEKTVTTRRLLNSIFSLTQKINWQVSSSLKLTAIEKEIAGLLKTDTNDARNKLPALLRKISPSQLIRLLAENDMPLRKSPAKSKATSGKNKFFNLFNKWKASGRQQEQTIQQIITDNRFFRHGVLSLLTNSSAPDLSSKLFTESWIMAGNDLRQQIYKLTGRQQQTYFSLLNTDRVSNKTQLALAKKILGAIKPATLGFIAFLTQLQEEEIKQLTNIPTEDDQSAGQFLVDNAGLCLIANYLPAFFNNLGFTSNNQFKTKIHAAKALKLLEYMAYNKNNNAEYRLQLNKLLCGLTPQEIMIADQKLNKKEYKEADELLKAVITNWASLKNTSIHGFRSAFLQRKGLLTKGAASWTLKVEKTGIDILLDSLPWNYTMIRLPWMPVMIEVEW